MSVENHTTRVEYRPIAGFSLYRVGNDGSVWSCCVGQEWRLLKPRKLRKGRLFVALYRDGKAYQFHVSSLVLSAFVGPRPQGLVCCHWDDDVTNNRIENLRWDTQKANSRDAIRNGRALRGERHPSATIKEDQVVEIRTMFAAGGITHGNIGIRYGITENMVAKIVSGATWKQAGGPITKVGRGNNRVGWRPKKR